MNPASEQFQFLDAAERGDAAAVESLLAAGADVNTRDDRRLPKGRTALMHAARNGHLEVMEALLAAGADLEVRDRGLGAALPGGNTALLLALKHRQARAALRLLDAGADPRPSSAGVSVLGEAAYLGDPLLLRKLLKCGLDPNGPASTRTDLPLASALYGRQTEAVRALLSAGADPDRVSRGDVVPLEIAVREGLTEAAQLLLHRGANFQRLTAKGRTLLALAVQHGRKDLVEILLRRGADPNARCRDGQTALDVAMQSVQHGSGKMESFSSRSPGSGSAAALSQLPDIIQVLQAAGARAGSQVPQPARRKTSAAISAKSTERSRPARTVAASKAGIHDLLELGRYTDPDFAVVAVAAPIGKAAEAFARYRRISRWIADVPCLKSAGLRRPRAAYITAVHVGEWTVIFRSLFRIGPADGQSVVEDARELSDRLETRAVALFRDSADESIGFSLFQKGHRSEHGQWLEHGPLRQFESKFRRRPAPEDSGEAYLDRLFKGMGIYLPACYPRHRRNGPVLCVEEASLSAIDRADLLVLPRPARAAASRATSRS